MTSKPLDAATIASLLKPAPGRTGTRRPKEDITQNRVVNVWFKLNHHLCVNDCEHRAQSPKGTACWNPDCVDTRDRDNRGVNMVALVKEQFMCRYCFLDGWLLK